MPVAIPADIAGLRVRIQAQASPLDHEVATALETDLVRAAVRVLTDDRQASDAQMRLALDVRAAGPVVEGIAILSVEHDGTLIERLSTSLDVYRRDRFAATVARQLAVAWAGSPRVAAFARAPRGDGRPPDTAAVVVAPTAATPTAIPVTTIPVAPTTATTAPAPESIARPPATVEPPRAPESTPIPPVRSGRFGVGLSLEFDLGWNQVFGPGSSPSGALAALAIQIDLGRRAALRLPASFAFAGSGNDTFGELALAPAILYRFQGETDQQWVPYIGLGLRLGAVVAGRHLLGRPVTGVATPDACGSRRRGTSSPIEDCAFSVSPEPVVGIEWHTGRLLSIDFAATYSFVHLRSNEGQISWLHLLHFFLGPRLSF